MGILVTGLGFLVEVSGFSVQDLKFRSFSLIMPDT